DPVPGHAGHVLHDRLAGAENAVDQGGLADVGSADHGQHRLPLRPEPGGAVSLGLRPVKFGAAVLGDVEVVADVYPAVIAGVDVRQFNSPPPGCFLPGGRTPRSPRCREVTPLLSCPAST